MVEVEILSREECQKAVENCLRRKDFELLFYQLNRLNTSGGFLGEHYTADLTVRYHGTANIEKTLRLFVKVEPQPTPGQQKLITQMNVFKKEVDTLSILFVKMRSTLRDGGKKMKWACECYYTRPDAIVLEDLHTKGFRNFTVRDTLHFEHFALALRALANLHTASIIYEEKQSTQPYRLIDDYADLFEEALFRHGGPLHPGTKWLEVSVETIWYLVELIFGEDTLMKMKTKLENLMLSLFDLQKPSTRFRNVVCQGDLKRDNILFRHEDDKPFEVYIVDYQLTRYAPPANDVICLLYLSANRQFRRQHSSQLLNVYYEQFSNNLKENGFNSDKILPWEEFKESCEFYKKLGVVIAACYAPTTYIPEEIIRHVLSSPEEVERLISVDRTPEIIKAYKSDSFFKENIKDVVEEFIEECSG